jgi:transposase
MRPDLGELAPGEGDLAELQLLLARRRDLVTDRTRAITRLRETLLAIFPALERALDLTRTGALTLVARYQTPSKIRRIGHKRLAAYLRNRHVQSADALAQKALTAAKGQNAALPAEEVAATIVAELAAEILALKVRVAKADEELQRRFFAHPMAEILASLPGMGSILGAEFLVAVGDVSAIESADRLAA